MPRRAARLKVLLSPEMGVDLTKHKEKWDALGNEDPLWVVLTDPTKRGNKWQIEDFFQTGKDEIEGLIKEISDLDLKIQVARGKALDFGCGVGRLTKALAQYFDEVTGVDISPSMIRNAEKYNDIGDKLTYVLNSRADLQVVPSNSMDLVYSSITLQHIPKCAIDNYIAEFVRIVHKDGLAIFQLPAGYDWTLRGFLLRLIPSNVLNMMRKKVYQCSTSFEMNYIPYKQVVHIVESSGGEIVHAKRDCGGGEGWISYRYFVRKKA